MTTFARHDGTGPRPVRVFSTCPQSRDVPASAYAQRVRDVSAWSEAAGCEGILVYADNGVLDPWLVSQLVVQETLELSPLVAVQPAYMHPFSVAQMVATFANLYGRRLYLNMVAGGFSNDLLALGQHAPHDERYARLVEYATIVKQLVEGGPVTFAGRFYAVSNLRLSASVSAELLPVMMVSGSSPPGVAAARQLAAVAVRYPQPAELEERHSDPNTQIGIRVGIIARADHNAAWRVAHERFPEDRAGQIAHGLAMNTSDSQWHRQLSDLDPAAAESRTPFWLGPFSNHKTFCPYLVGDYQEVAAEISRYVELGVETFILDVPASAEELAHTARVFEMARTPGTR